MTKLRSLGTGISAFLLILLVLTALTPFVLMLVTALQDTTVLTWSIDPAKVGLQNFALIFSSYGFGRAIVNSAIVVILACVVNVVVCSLAAYAFAKKPFPGSKALFWVYLATMMMPGQITLIPLFLIMRDLGLLNTYISLALPIVNAFGVFLIYQFMVGMPDELIEAAKIDGARDLRIFLSIVVPLIRPVLVALTVFTFLSVWNDFLWPLVSISNEKMQTVTLAVANLQGNFMTRYGLVMAGATIAFAVPLMVYVVLQRSFVEGVASVGIKG